MQGFFDFVKSLGAARMAAMAAVTLGLIGFFSFLMIQMTTPTMVPLFTDLSVEDSSAKMCIRDRTVPIRSICCAATPPAWSAPCRMPA